MRPKGGSLLDSGRHWFLEDSPPSYQHMTAGWFLNDYRLADLFLNPVPNLEFPDVQAGFRKGRGTRDQIANFCWIIEKARELKKIFFTLASLTMLKPLTAWITTNYGIFLKRMGIPD